MGLLVVTVNDKPLYKIFTNYNKVGKCKENNGTLVPLTVFNTGLTLLNYVIKPKDGLRKVLLWEM